MKFYVYVMALWSIGLFAARFCLVADIRRHLGIGLTAAFAIITFAGLVISNPIVFLSLCFICFFIGVRTPLDAACRFLLLTAMVPHIAVRISPGGMYIMDLQPMKVFAVAFALVCLIRGVGSRAVSRKISSEDIAIVALALVTTFGAYRELTVTSEARQIVTVCFLLLPLFLLRRHSSRPEDVRVLLGVFAGAGAVLAVLAAYEAGRGWSLFDPVWQHLNVEDVMSRNLRLRGGLMRSPVTFAESTSFAVFQLSAMVIATFARNSFRSTSKWLLCCALIALGLLCAQSRGALLGLFVALVVTLVFKRAYVRAAIVAGGAAVSVALLLSLARTNSRISGFVQADAALEGTDYRQRLLSRGLEVGYAHPWFGSDFAHLNLALADMTQGEHIVDFVNSYLTLFLTGGLIGMAAFLAPVMLTYFKLWRAGRSGAGGTGPSSQAAAVGMLTAVLTALTFTSLYERNPFWLLLALTFARAAIPRRAKTQALVASSAMPAKHSTPAVNA